MLRNIYGIHIVSSMNGCSFAWRRMNLFFFCSMEIIWTNDFIVRANLASSIEFLLTRNTFNSIISRNTKLNLIPTLKWQTNSPMLAQLNTNAIVVELVFFCHQFLPQHQCEQQIGLFHKSIFDEWQTLIHWMHFFPYFSRPAQHPVRFDSVFALSSERHITVCRRQFAFRIPHTN